MFYGADGKRQYHQGPIMEGGDCVVVYIKANKTIINGQFYDKYRYYLPFDYGIYAFKEIIFL